MTSVSSTLQSSPSQTGSELSELNRRPGRAASLSPPPPAASDTVALQSDSSAGAPPSDAAVAGAEEGGGGGDGSGGSGSERQPGVSRHHRSLSSRFSGLFSGGAGGGGAGAGAGGAAAGGAPTSWSSSLRRRSDPAGLETGGGGPSATWGSLAAWFGNNGGGSAAGSDDGSGSWHSGGSSSGDDDEGEPDPDQARGRRSGGQGGGELIAPASGLGGNADWESPEGLASCWDGMIVAVAGDLERSALPLLSTRQNRRQHSGSGSGHGVPRLEGLGPAAGAEGMITGQVGVVASMQRPAPAPGQHHAAGKRHAAGPGGGSHVHASGHTHAHSHADGQPGGGVGGGCDPRASTLQAVAAAARELPPEGCTMEPGQMWPSGGLIGSLAQALLGQGQPATHTHNALSPKSAGVDVVHTSTAAGVPLPYSATGRLESPRSRQRGAGGEAVEAATAAGRRASIHEQVEQLQHGTPTFNISDPLQAVDELAAGSHIDLEELEGRRTPRKLYPPGTLLWIVYDTQAAVSEAAEEGEAVPGPGAEEAGRGAVPGTGAEEAGRGARAEGVKGGQAVGSSALAGELAASREAASYPSVGGRPTPGIRAGAGGGSSGTEAVAARHCSSSSISTEAGGTGHSGGCSGTDTEQRFYSADEASSSSTVDVVIAPLYVPPPPSLPSQRPEPQAATPSLAFQAAMANMAAAYGLPSSSSPGTSRPIIVSTSVDGISAPPPGLTASRRPAGVGAGSAGAGEEREPLLPPSPWLDGSGLSKRVAEGFRKLRTGVESMARAVTGGEEGNSR